MATCSICADPKAVEIINELLDKKTGLDVIAEQTGVHRSSVHRHSKKCFPAWRAARLKNRNRKNDEPGRVFVQWPGDAPSGLENVLTCNYSCESVPASQIGPNDVIFVLTYAAPLAERIQAVPAAPSSNAASPA